MALLILMLKTTVLLDKLTLEWLEVDDSKVDRFDIGDDKKIAKKLKKSSKFWKLAKWGKKLSKSGNLPNFSTAKTGPKFLIFDTRTTFNHLWLIFMKALILWYFDLEC